MSSSPPIGLAARIRTAAVPPLLGALLGGASLGLVESLHVLTQAFGTRDYSGVVQAVLLYGAGGLLVGLLLAGVAVGLALAFREPPEPARSWTVAWLVVFCVGGYAVAEFVGERDLSGGAPLGPNARALIVLGLCVFAAVFYLFTRNALKKTFFSFLLHPIGTGAVYLACVLFTLLFAVGTMINNRADADVAPRPVAPSLLDRPNLLLVVVDDLRADALDERLTPALTRLAQEGTVYAHALAHSPSTRPSFASVLTSQVPCAHQAIGPTAVLPDDVDTVAEVLSRHGYTTGAIVTSVDATASFNFDQGFDTFRFLRPQWMLRASEASYRLMLYDRLRRLRAATSGPPDRADRYYRDATAVSDAAVDWLRRHGGERWFLMVEYRDPARPLVEHPQLARAAADPVARAAGGGGPAGPTVEALYRGEVGWFDQGLGQVLAYMDERDLLDSTAVIVTGLHGTTFAVDPSRGGLGSDMLRVPLLVRRADADVSSARVVRDPVRHVDVAPTLVQLAGAPEGAGWQGTSLLREYALRGPLDRLAYAESHQSGVAAAAVRDGDWTLIDRGGQAALFFVEEDPDEVDDLSRKTGAAWKLDEKRAQLRAIREALCVTLRGPELGERELTVEDCEVLRRLGYQEGFSERCRAQ